MRSDVECPYCGKWQDINHNDGFGYEEDVLHEQECQFCDKTFVFLTVVTYSYEATKADCLNGSEHNFMPTTTIPKEFTKMQCPDCGQTRELTPEERNEMGIGSKEDYFANLKNCPL